MELMMYFLTIVVFAAAMFTGAIISLLILSGGLLLADTIFKTKFGRKIVRKIIKYFYDEG